VWGKEQHWNVKRGSGNNYCTSYTTCNYDDEQWDSNEIMNKELGFSLLFCQRERFPGHLDDFFGSGVSFIDDAVGSDIR
jgi:hypothetical protein